MHSDAWLSSNLFIELDSAATWLTSRSSTIVDRTVAYLGVHAATYTDRIGSKIKVSTLYQTKDSI